MQVCDVFNGGEDGLALHFLTVSAGIKTLSTESLQLIATLWRK